MVPTTAARGLTNHGKATHDTAPSHAASDVSFLTDGSALYFSSKALTAKVGSLDAVTQSRFDLMLAFMGGININWSKIIFRILKAMVVPLAKKARGFAVQLSLLLEGVPRLKLQKVGVTKVKRLKDLCTRADAFIQPAVKRKRTTIGRPAVRPTEPIQMTRPPKRKLILLEDSDSEDPKPLPKETKVSAHVFQTSMSRMRAQILAVPDDESLSLDALYRILKGKSYTPSPSLPKIAPADKGKNVLVEKAKGNPVKEKIALIFADLEFLIKIRDSVFIRVREDLQLSGFEQPKWIRDHSKAHMAKLLRWTEMDSIRVAFKRRLMDLDLVRKAPEAGVLKSRRLHYMQALVWGGEAINRITRAQDEGILTKHSMDRVLSRHNDLWGNSMSCVLKGMTRKKYLCLLRTWLQWLYGLDKANVCSEAEHPASFLDVVQELKNIPEEEEAAEEDSSGAETSAHPTDRDEKLSNNIENGETRA
ncbi:hypothetical protein F511_03497 [Dorcoceras hygrometricum]|uniref:Uncharacterized protein n=1 Tax=Dorcoceras hygrometricum TaxID=472368 RepID=A0A2Z7ATH7_9LAMI|nr:hypothetical protein F511_03497 [Dorcoceras hygrometricum]